MNGKMTTVEGTFKVPRLASKPSPMTAWKVSERKRRNQVSKRRRREESVEEDCRLVMKDLKDS